MAAQIPDHIRKFLEKPNFAVLATQSGGRWVQATPVWFMYDQGHILINTRDGRTKLRNMQAHPEVALAIVDRENPYCYVQIQGKVAAFDKPSGGKDIDRLSQRYRGQAYAYPAGDGPQHRVSLHIVPERVQTMGL